MADTKDGIFGHPEFKKYQSRWQSRVTELFRRRLYYDGAIYRSLRQLAKSHVHNAPFLPRLYRGIKPLYLPLARAVDVDVGIIPGDWELAEDLPDTMTEARDALFAMSNWTTRGPLYVHYGAQYGLSGLRVADLQEEKRVILAPIDPTTFMLVETSPYDETPALAIVVEEREDDAGPFEYAEVITPDLIRTFKDGEPAGFAERDPEYQNALEFVPFVEVKHIETGHPLGEATYQKAIPMLNEVNEIASYLADIIKKHAEAQWLVTGAEPSELEKSGDNVWFIPAGGDAKALVAQIDVAGVLAFVQEIRDQVHGSLPELAFDELKKKDQIATATLELQLMELVLKIQRTRPNYDDGLVGAMQMAGRAAQTMGLGDIALLDSDDLEMDATRPVLPLDKKTELEIEMQELVLERERALGIVEGEPVA